MTRALTGAAVIVAVVVGGCGASSEPTSEKTKAISRATFHGRWPFTVARGILHCVPDKTAFTGVAVEFEAHGLTYPLVLFNGDRIREPANSGIRAIWRKDPDHPGFRIDTIDVQNAGDALCGGAR